MGEPHVDEICSTIGNVARIAAVLELHEVLAACEAAAAQPLELVLLDPHRSPLRRARTCRIEESSKPSCSSDGTSRPFGASPMTSNSQNKPGGMAWRNSTRESDG